MSVNTILDLVGVADKKEISYQIFLLLLKITACLYYEFRPTLYID